jgi:hypothetical protein
MVVAVLLKRIAIAPLLVCAWAASGFAQSDDRLKEYILRNGYAARLGASPPNHEGTTELVIVLLLIVVVFLACLAFLRSTTARMPILRRNFFRAWLLCSVIWVVFICDRLYEVGRLREYEDMFIVSLITIILLLTGLRLAPTWEFFTSNWLRLSEHVRRGLARLYLVVSVPWTAWFGYRLLDALQRDRWHPWHASLNALWSLLIVPIGGPIVLAAMLWVIAGFRDGNPTFPINEEERVARPQKPPK